MMTQILQATLVNGLYIEVRFVKFLVQIKSGNVNAYRRRNLNTKAHCASLKLWQVVHKQHTSSQASAKSYSLFRFRSEGFHVFPQRVYIKDSCWKHERRIHCQIWVGQLSIKSTIVCHSNISQKSTKLTEVTRDLKYERIPVSIERGLCLFATIFSVWTYSWCFSPQHRHCKRPIWMLNLRRRCRWNKTKSRFISGCCFNFFPPISFYFNWIKTFNSLFDWLVQLWP